MLVVDDERALRRMASRMLERMGVTSEDLDDGKHCETVLRQRGQIPSMGDLPLDTKISRGAEVGGMREREGEGEGKGGRIGRKFDAILMDIVMVHSRGTDVCKHLLDLGCRVPIFAMTANHDAWMLPSYREAGFYGLLPKPYSSK